MRFSEACERAFSEAKEQRDTFVVVQVTTQIDTTFGYMHQREYTGSNAVAEAINLIVDGPVSVIIAATIHPI